MYNKHYTNKTHISNSSKTHIQQPYFNISTYTQNLRKLGIETWNRMKIRENSYLFLKIDEGLKKKMEVLRVRIEVLGEGEVEKTNGYARDAREN